MRIATLLTLLAVLVIPSTVLLAEPAFAPDKDCWYALYVNGIKSGWMHMRTETKTIADEKRFVSVVEMSMTLSRGPSEMTILTRETTEEDASGKVVRFGGSVATPLDVPVDIEPEIYILKWQVTGVGYLEFQDDDVLVLLPEPGRRVLYHGHAQG